MSVSKVLFIVGLIFVHVGGLAGLIGAWTLGGSDPDNGANIGSGILVMLATGILGIGFLLEIIALVVSRSASSSTGLPQPQR